MKRYLTDEKRTFEPSRLFAAPAIGTPEMNLVKAYPDVAFQPVVGFGAALTEASGYVFAHMEPEMRERFIDLCFGRGGNCYSLTRLSIQSCDFSLAPRPYLRARNEALEGFSIDDDWGYVLPLVKEAQAANPGLQFLASPWSPPAWAKTNRSMKFGGHLRRDSYGIWARMITRALLAYRAEGVGIGRITVQNEANARQTWESCLYTAEQERDFLRDHLKPALRAGGLDDVKVLAWDHNKEGLLDRACAIMTDPAASDALDGMAFHWYSGDHFEAVRAAREAIGPDREPIFTEGCDSFSGGDPEREIPHAEHYAHEVIGDLEAGANGIIDWNILLDAQGGPNHVGNFCDAPIMYDTAARTLNVRRPFHYLGHFSRFVQPGARRILVTRCRDDVETCGFANPDGSHALVVLNRRWWDVDFELCVHPARGHESVAKVSAPAHSIQTICW